MRVLMIGDVVGRPGRNILIHDLENIKQETKADFINANLENASGGNGITEKNLQEVLKAPIDSVTMGNHTFNQKDAAECLERYPLMVRPLNYPKGTPGKGSTVIEKDGVRYGILNVSGQTFMGDLDSPFPIAEKVLERLQNKSDIVLVDFHAETTSEKMAFGYHFDGAASAIVGTHTHVQTADERVLEGGTAYITDLGMTGPKESILGIKKDIIINKFITKLPKRFEVELGFPWMFNGALIDIDENTGKARSIERIQKIYNEDFRK